MTSGTPNSSAEIDGLVIEGFIMPIKCKNTSAYSVSVSESTENVGVFDTFTYTDTNGYLKNDFIIGRTGLRSFISRLPLIVFFGKHHTMATVVTK